MMLTFETLNFEQQPELGNNVIQAKVRFNNSGLQLVVNRQPGADGFELHRYEVTVLENNVVVAFPPITHDDKAPRGFLKQYEITKMIARMSDIIGADPYQI